MGVLLGSQHGKVGNQSWVEALLRGQRRGEERGESGGKSCLLRHNSRLSGRQLYGSGAFSARRPFARRTN